MPDKWAGAEAWILVSIGDATRSGPAKLHEVLAMADANNHAVPTTSEFSLAISQLLGAGLVVVSDRFALSAAGKRVYESINAQRRNRIDRFLQTAEDWRRQAPSNSEPVTWEVSQEEFDGAYKQYNR